MLVEPKHAIDKLTKSLVNISDVVNGKSCICRNKIINTL